jgi:CheY-like chemotaxis protein
LVDPARLRQLLDRLVAHVLARTSVGRVVVAVDGEAGVGGIRFTVSSPVPIGVVDGGVMLAEQLARAMGGTLTVVADAQTFAVWLPLEPTDLPAIDLEHEPSLAAAAVHVLVVDDEPVNRMLAVEQLGRLGMRASAVGSGEEAVDAMAVADPPQLVLMDVVMPGIDGLEATRRVREGERRTGRRAVIIGVTASSLATDRLAADEAGMDDVLGKPVSLGMLTDALGKWVRGGLRTDADPNAVDPTAIDDLCADLGGAAPVSNVVRMYLNELHGRRLALAEAVDRGDLAAAKAVAHTLKSGSAMLGARRVADACEHVGRLHTTVDLHQATADVMRTSTAAARWLHDWLARQP